MSFTRTKKAIIGFVGMLLLVACQDFPFYSTYKSVNVEGWEARDTLVYKLPVVESPSAYDVSVAVRTSQGFKYENLALAIRLYEGKKTISVDTVKFKLYGTNNEQKGTGFTYVENEISLKHQFKLKPQKKYKVKITHIMRLDPFDGVCDVGLNMK